MLEAIKDFFEDFELHDLFFWLACIVCFIMLVIAIYLHFNLPDTIMCNGYVYERQTEPEQTIEYFGCTYVLKEIEE